MDKPDSNNSNPESSGRLNEKTVRLLQKALAVSPGDWETRGHLISHHLAANEFSRAAELLQGAPAAPDTEDGLLLQARVESETDHPRAIKTLERVLLGNRACARAYFQLARIYRKLGLVEDARKKYGAATVIDESLTDPEWEAWLGRPAAQERTPKPEPGVGRISEEEELDESLALVPAEEMAAAMRDLDLVVEPPSKRITFHDIGGMQDVIERIRMNIIYPFKNPKVFQKFNRTSGGGILLYGPPGCGKTHIARATAGECDAAFIPIGVTDVLSKWLGESERHLHELFETARRRAPAVIFLDEIDAVGMSRSEASASLGPLVNVLLTEMDGIAADNKNVMVLAATNAPWRVDSALRRPGRFDRVIFVPPPDVAARAAILDIHLRDMPVDKVDTAKLAKLTEKFSGADLRALVARASEQAIIAEMKTGTESKVTQKMLLEAAKEMRASTIEWLESARNYASYANRAGLYDDLVKYFEQR